MREIVKLAVQMKKPGRPTYLNGYEESLVIASANIEGVHDLPFGFRGVAMQLQNNVKAFKSRCGDNDILPKSSLSYFQEVIKRVNKMDDEHEDQKIRSRAGLVKVSILSKTRASHIDPGLACIMVHKIASIYMYLKHQHTIQEFIAIKNLKSSSYFYPPYLYQPT